jgi:ribosome-binding protein aMBF1 (putative translation factor)
MDTKNKCEFCDKEITGTVYDLNDEPACQSCYDHAVDMAEYAYESWRENDMLENQATGN